MVDTGGWYKLCCPTSQLHKPDVLGAIYRVRRQGRAAGRGPARAEAGLGDDGRRAELAEPARRPPPGRAPAGRSRPWRRRGESGRRGAGAGRARAERSAEARRNAVWAATRIDRPDARRRRPRRPWPIRDETRPPGGDPLGELWRDREAVPAAGRAAPDQTSLHNRRAAAEALGRIGDKSAVPALLKAVGERSAPTASLEHSLTYALIEIGDPKATAAGLPAPNPRVRRARPGRARPDGRGRPRPATGRRGCSPRATPDLKETASWIVGRHPEWAGALAGFFRERLIEGRTCRRPSGPSSSGSSPGSPRLAGDPGTPGRAGSRDRLGPAAGQAEQRCGRWPRSGLKDVPGVLDRGAGEASSRAATRELDRQAVATARALAAEPGKGRAARPALLAIAEPRRRPAELRLEALAAVPGGPARGRARRSSRSCSGSSTATSPSPTRTAAADVLARGQARPRPARSPWPTRSKTAGPLEVDRLLTAFEQSTDEARRPEAGRRPWASRRPCRSLRADALKQHLAKYGPPVQAAGRGAVRQAQRRRRQAEGPARRAPGQVSERRRPPRPGWSSTARRRPASPATPSATSAARSAPT